MLLEGPAVLGPEALRRIDLATGGRELRRGLEEALGAEVPPERSAALADLISAMFDRAALATQLGADQRSYAEALRDLLALVARSDP